MGGTPPELAKPSGSCPVKLPALAWDAYVVLKQFCWPPFSDVPFLQMSTGVDPPTLSETKLSTRTLPLPSGEDERTAWTGETAHCRFKIVLLKVFASSPWPVPWVDTLTLAGLNSWMAF